MKKRIVINLIRVYIIFQIFIILTSCVLPAQADQKSNPPSIAISIPTNNQTVSSNLYVYGTASGNPAIKSVYLRIDNNTFIPADGKEKWSRNISLADGTHTINAFSRNINDTDSATNEISVTADSSFPIAAISSPTNNESIQTNFTLNGTAYDNTGIEGVYLSVDGCVYSKVTGTSSWSTNLIVSKADHTYTVYARDIDLNTGSAAMIYTHPRAEQNPFIQARKLGRGVNMGNCLEAAPSEGWGVRIEDNYFQLIKQAGFNSVRIPIRWSTNALTSPPYTIDPVLFARVDSVVSNALANNLTVVINDHHYLEMFTDPDAHLPRLISIWQQIADRYKDKPDTLYFELLNEPNGSLTAAKWNTIAAALVDAIRAIDPYRTIVIGGVDWNGISGLQQLTLPARTNLIATFHFYDPFIFTHQTADWSDPSIMNLSNVLWPNILPDPTNTVPMPSGAPSWIADQINAYNTHDVNMPGGKNDIISKFTTVSNWAAAHNIPVWIGEFGSYSGVNNSSDMPSRIKWTGFVRTTAEKFGFATAYWEFCAGFGIYPYKDGPWKDGLTNALLSNW